MRTSATDLFKAACVASIAAGFWMASSPAFSAITPAGRVIELEGTTNTRDIGGYVTEDFRTLRAGQIIRSEKLSRLTEDDFRILEDIGVKTVIDLRTSEEHERHPTQWQGDNPARIVHIPVFEDGNDWYRAQGRMFKKKRFSQEQSLAQMVDGYRLIAKVGAPAFEQVMAVVRDESNWPILIHCSAGKDRSGIAVALIMEAVGVDRETIMEDYLLTNEVGRSAKKAELLAEQSEQRSRTRRGTPADAWLPIVGVQAEMLDAWYEDISAGYGSVDAYLDELGMGPERRKALAASLTTVRPEGSMGQ